MNEERAAISIGAAAGQSMVSGTIQRYADGSPLFLAFASVAPFLSPSYGGKKSSHRFQMKGV